MKDKVLDILFNLYEDVQSMREEGETDIRSVLHFINDAIKEVNELNGGLSNGN